MKKQILSLVSILWALTSIAAVRTPQEAAMIAGRFAASQGRTITKRIAGAKQTGTTTIPVTLAYTQHMAQSDTAALYVFNTSNDKGFVVVSADDNTRAVLGYTDRGTFSEASMPANMRFWLQMYADEIAYASAQTTTLNETDSITYPEVAPLLGDMEWGQDAPYNDSCPKPKGYECATGCAATAVAQVMRYHKYPTQGTGSHAYIHRFIVGSDTLVYTLSADFAHTSYDWTNMLSTYSGVSYTAQQSAAVAQLMYHIGVACEMTYGSSSSTSGTDAMRAMQTYFGYDAGMEMLHKDLMPENELLNRISAELQAGRPMFVSGRTVQNEGHAFVLDGIKNNGYVHINWGWDGYCNANFAISALQPMGQGTGGAASGYAFTENVTVVVGIQPYKGGVGVPQVTADSIFILSNSRVRKGADISFGIANFTNNGLSDIQDGLMVVAVYKDSNLLQTIQESYFSLDANYYYEGTAGFKESFTDLPKGNYEIALAVTIGTSTLYPVLCKDVHGEKRFLLSVTTDSVIVGDTVPIPPSTALYDTESECRISSFTHTITIESDNAQSMSITDAMGRLLAAKEQTCYLRLQAMPAGVYIVRCGDKIQKVLVKE